MNNLPRPMKSCFLLTLACAVPALGQMMYNPPASGGGAPAAPPSSPPAAQPNAYQPSRQGDAKSLYGNEIPFLNPQDGTVTINGTIAADGEAGSNYNGGGAGGATWLAGE